MVPELYQLSASEMELVYKAPILVCILIAGADGTIDRKEIKEAIRFAEKKKEKSTSSVSILIHEVATDFEDKLKILLQNYPYESTQRNALIAEELAHLNDLWSKIEPRFAKEFYQTLLSIAEKIATSSGGVLGYNAVGAEEARYIRLDMINNPATT
ncbi:MAG: hypothetical protein KF687_11860 [Cyclobacteriaceae bacterium]|nr:hypothetical protein [Cyclobacteriaceae bacterium]